ncbi:MAG: tetratricopeptide repeat protein [Methylobacter sp.]
MSVAGYGPTVMCLRPMDSLPPACVGRQDDTTVNTALMRFPPRHPLVGELYEQAAKLGQNVQWGQAGPLLITRLLSNYTDVEVLPVTAFYPVHWSEAWRLITQEQSGHCAGVAAESYAVHWWNEIFRRMGIPKDKLPPADSYLGRYAASVLDGGWDEWPDSVIATWVENFRAASLAEPVRRYLQGQAEFAGLMRDLGRERLNDGHWQQAAELLTAAHRARPNGLYIRKLLAQALAGLGRREEAEALLTGIKTD